MVQPLWKTVWKFLRTPKSELPYDSAVPHPAIYPKNPDNINSKRYMHPMFIVTLFTIAKQPKCLSIDEWIKNIYNGILFSHKESEIIPCAPTWMDPEIIIEC